MLCRKITFFRSRGCLGGEAKTKNKKKAEAHPRFRVACCEKKKQQPPAHGTRRASLCLPPFRATPLTFPRFMDGRLPAAAAAAVAGAALMGGCAFAASPAMARFKAATRAVDEVSDVCVWWRRWVG